MRAFIPAVSAASQFFVRRAYDSLCRGVFTQHRRRIPAPGSRVLPEGTMKTMSSGVRQAPIADTGLNASLPSKPHVDAPPAGRSAAECRELFLNEQETIKAAIAQIARRY